MRPDWQSVFHGRLTFFADCWASGIIATVGGFSGSAEATSVHPLKPAISSAPSAGGSVCRTSGHESEFGPVLGQAVEVIGSGGYGLVDGCLVAFGPDSDAGVDEFAVGAFIGDVILATEIGDAGV